MRNALEVERLTKRFGDFTAVDNISFTVREGEIFGRARRPPCGCCAA